MNFWELLGIRFVTSNSNSKEFECVKGGSDYFEIKGPFGETIRSGSHTRVTVKNPGNVPDRIMQQMMQNDIPMFEQDTPPRLRSWDEDGL